MLFLNKKDITSADRQLIQDAVFNAYTLMNNGNYNMPDRTHVQDGDNTLLLMPCFGGDYFATKLVSVFPGAVDKGLPAVNGIMTLADNTTGQPLAVMDGAAVTAERTGAVGGLGGLYLTGTQLKTAGILGAGVQGYSQARYLLLNRKIDTLLIGDMYPEAARSMADRLAADFPGVEFRVAPGADDLVADSELVIAATTSTRPLFSDDAGLVKDKTFISIGSFRPDMKEFPDAVIKTADKIYVDTLFAAKESGDICEPLKQGIVKKEEIRAFADLIKEPAPGHNNGTLFFKSVGMALFDLTVASALYEFAKEKQLGVTLDF
ncbi:MAG: ornithine cyclodeaminase family protein [Desulfobacterales bacterium]|nr:ornithine cyclodeaminase family protein [Desulfobacterales bacterium]